MSQSAAFQEVKDVVIDAWFTTDPSGVIVDFNRVFFSLFPRNVARKLKGLTLSEIMSMPMDIVQEAVDQNRQVRFDEVVATILETQEEFRFILSAIPLFGEEKALEGTLVILRNVTDEAMVQIKYQEMLEREARERELLKAELVRRTERLIQISERYYELKAQIRKRAKGQVSPFKLKI
ncbi:PAS domain-containing protein [Myxococcota bacterium]|nr:PAS domain-containing protein [Myxococcota bacterium]